MSRDTIVYCTCTFLLGLVIGSFAIGPHLAPKPATATVAEAAAPPPQAASPMEQVRETITRLKDQVARDPKNADALIQLANMYMDAAKYPDAIGYYERALAIREDANVRIDIGICYKQNGQLDKALEAFRRAGSEAPDQWQPLYNEAIVLGEMKRFDDARIIAAKLEKMRPGDAEVQKLQQALAAAH
jgi:tetratricopeptide (TPR) repeat protein